MRVAFPSRFALMVMGFATGVASNASAEPVIGDPNALIGSDAWTIERDFGASQAAGAMLSVQRFRTENPVQESPLLSARDPAPVHFFSIDEEARQDMVLRRLVTSRTTTTPAWTTSEPAEEPPAATRDVPVGQHVDIQRDLPAVAEAERIDSDDADEKEVAVPPPPKSPDTDAAQSQAEVVAAIEPQAGDATAALDPPALTASESEDLARKGDPVAQFTLGLMYARGDGVPRDYEEAIKWYRRSAEQGYPPSMLNLGVEYGKGWGVTQDYLEAYMWFDLAVALLETGEKRNRAMRNRHLAGLHLTPEEISEAERLAREWRERYGL